MIDHDHVCSDDCLAFEPLATIIERTRTWDED